jgi:hypothetical protein
MPQRSLGSTRLRLASFIAIASVAGCLLTSDFDNIAGVRPPAEGGEGAVEDAGANADGPFDCNAATHTVCTDFDQTGNLPVPGWSHATTGTGVLTLDEAAAVTSPRSLRAKIIGTNGTSAYIYRNVFLGSFKAVKVAFDVQIVACPAQGTSVTLVFLQPSETASFGLVVLSSGAHALGASVDGGSTFFNLEEQLPTGRWAHVVYDILIKDPSTAHFELLLDGKKVVDTDAPSSTIRPTTLLNLGALALGGAPKGCEVLFDNYVLDKE